jgi:hypothetical protein
MQWYLEYHRLTRIAPERDILVTIRGVWRNMMAYSSVGDLTVEEFKSLVKEVVTETMLEILSDPDEDLELREEIKARLRRSLAVSQANGETRSAQEVATKLGLEW